MILLPFNSGILVYIMANGYEDIDISGMDEEERFATLLTRGEEIYTSNCIACHQATGEGIDGVYPPLKSSDYYGDAQTHARIIVHGLTGEIVVNGQTYNNNMNSFKQFSDFNIAAVATYERNSWGNEDGIVLPEDVEAVR
jgi:mono/diheme cytochrome c family protein